MIKEAKSLRGLADIFGCVNGIFVSLEVKKTEEESQETTGRAVLQRHTLQLIREAGGYASFIHPDNERYILDDLRRISETKVS